MKKTRLILLCIAGILFAGALVAVGVAETRYGAIRSAPRISHEELASPLTCVRAVLRPHQAPEFFGRLVRPDKTFPRWFLNSVLPYETAALFDADLAAGRITTTLFVNEKRLGPVLARAARTSPQWSAFPPVLKRRGLLLAETITPIEAQILDAMGSRWSEAAVAEPMHTEGGHLVEVVLDNREGGACAAIATLFRLRLPESQEVDWVQATSFAAGVSTIRAYADVTSEQVLEIHMRIDCNPQEQSPQFIQFLVNAGYETLRSQLHERYGLKLSGTSSQVDDSIQGVYKLGSLDTLLAVACRQMR